MIPRPIRAPAVPAPPALLALLVLLATAVAAPASAQPNPPVYDRVDLSASAAREIGNDLVIAVVFAEVENNAQAQAADAVNTAIRWAVERARAVAGVEIKTQQYTTRPVYANTRRIVGWVARQSLRLESTDAEALSTLLGELQDRVAIESLGSGLSKAARDAAEEALIAEALAAGIVDQHVDRCVGEPGRQRPRLLDAIALPESVRNLGIRSGPAAIPGTTLGSSTACREASHGDPARSGRGRRFCRAAGLPAPPARDDVALPDRGGAPSAVSAAADRGRPAAATLRRGGV